MNILAESPNRLSAYKSFFVSGKAHYAFLLHLNM